MTFPSFADFCKIFALFGKTLDIVYFFYIRERNHEGRFIWLIRTRTSTGLIKNSLPIVFSVCTSRTHLGPYLSGNWICSFLRTLKRWEGFKVVSRGTSRKN